MKFANIYNITSLYKQKNSFLLNLGDIFQFVTIDSIYELMGIPSDEIHYIKVEEFASYKGETLILPLNFSIENEPYVKDGRLNMSEDIIPVFLGMTFAKTNSGHYDPDDFLAIQENTDYLRRFGPIGCRDEYTMKKLLKHNIPAYLNGCITALLPQRTAEESANAQKIFCVDAPYSVLEYIPKSIKNKLTIETQQYYKTKEFMEDKNTVFSFVKEKYQYYKKTASLMITSRLHVAVPCHAMGIPVIFTKDFIDHRFSWLEKLMPLYTPDKYDKINWNPTCTNYEEIKKTMLELIIQRLTETKEKYKNYRTVSDFFKSRTTYSSYTHGREAIHKNFAPFDAYAKKYWDKNTKIRYALWGITDCSEDWCSHIEKQYPQAELVAAIDSFKTGTFKKITIIKPEKMKDKDVAIIVTGTGATNAAKNLFEQLSRPKSSYCLTGELFINKETK